MENTGILVYCITEEFSKDLSEIKGLDENYNLYAVSSNDLYAIVSNVNLDEYGEENMAEKGEDIEWLKEKATMFMDVILKILSITNMIPMKFLTIFLTEDRVKDIIIENLEDFQSIFKKINNRNEVSVKIYCDTKKFKEATLSEEISSFEKTLIGKPKGAAFFLKKKFEGELDEKIQNRICDIANRIAEELNSLAFEMKSNKILAKEISGIETPMVLNCAYLVEKDKTEDFAEKIDEFRKKYEESGFLIEISGPWPPYSFC